MIGTRANRIEVAIRDIDACIGSIALVFYKIRNIEYHRLSDSLAVHINDLGKIPVDIPFGAFQRDAIPCERVVRIAKRSTGVHHCGNHQVRSMHLGVIIAPLKYCRTGIRHILPCCRIISDRAGEGISHGLFSIRVTMQNIANQCIVFPRTTVLPAILNW